MNEYGIAEVFFTLQGEGANVGRRAIFVRFRGCNLWTGRDDRRAESAERNGAKCPLWCDTDFVQGGRRTLAEIEAEIKALVAKHGAPDLVVFTGGEPLMQLDADLVQAAREASGRARLAIETNGTIESPVLAALDWICVSPKVRPEDIKVRHGHELKVVFPAYDPEAYEDLADGFEHRFVSPQADAGPRVGTSLLRVDHTKAALDFVLSHPGWRLSLQTHRIMEIP